MRTRLLVAMVCCLTLSACATNGGVQVEGLAPQVSPPPTSVPPPSDVPPSADAVAILRADPKVSDKIKAMLTPCAADHYPLDTRYADVTNDGVLDMFVTVLSCETKGVGFDFHDNLATYVYDLKPSGPVQVFAMEEAGVEAYAQDSATIAVARVQWRARDKPCCPSGVDTTLYRWNGTEFAQVKK